MTGALLVAAVTPAAFVIAATVRRVALKRELLDRPNERSAHVVPTPRLGGIGIVAAFFPAAIAMLATGRGDLRAFAVVGCTAAISLVGLIDDLRPLPARVRFAAQLAAAIAVVAARGTGVSDAWTLVALPAWIAAPLSVLWIVWLTNLYNFMDGIDGLAGGQAVIGGAAIACAAFLTGATLHAELAAAAAAAALGFLVLNFPPARIFMGDVGSTALGFFFASLPFLPAPGGASVSVEVVALALALFILDATWTVVRRMLRGERFFQAHRTHWYQRPLAQGVSHRAITLAVYPGMIAVGLEAVVYPWMATPDRLLLLAFAVVIFGVYAAAVVRLEKLAAGSLIRTMPT